MLTSTSGRNKILSSPTMNSTDTERTDTATMSLLLLTGSLRASDCSMSAALRRTV